jgi:hypothetical protein
MIEKKWFINIDGQVTGPFTPDNVEENLKRHATARVWGRGLSHWVSPSDWLDKLKNPPEPSHSSIIEWKFRMNGVESKASSLKDMIKILKGQNLQGQLEVWSSAKPHWQTIYAVPEVADQLGLSRRSHSRVPILGTYTGEGPEGPFKYNLFTISEGGVGLVDCVDFKIGDHLKGVISSPNLPIEITCFSEVVYSGQGGVIGLQFTSLPIEASSVLIEYVRKFEEA